MAAISDFFAKFRKKKVFQKYEFKKVQFDLPEDGPIQYAQWLHPGEFGKVVTQGSVSFYRKYIKPGDFVIDIGANEGDTTVPMAIATGVKGVTLGIEPNPHVFKVLEFNAGLNKDKTNIVPLSFAATADDGEYVYGSGDPSYGNGGIVGYTHNEKRNVRYTFKVTGKNLHKYLLQNYAGQMPKLTFIKIDTEGYDKEIIKTIPDIIKNHRPYLVAECFGPSTKDEKLELYDLLTGYNYSLYRIDDADFNNLHQIKRDDIATKKTYNFLAIPKEKE